MHTINPEICTHSEQNPFETQSSGCSQRQPLIRCISLAWCQSLAVISVKRLSAAPSRWNSSVVLSLLVLNDRGRCLWSRDIRVWVSGRHATPPRRLNSVRWSLIQCEWVKNNQAASPMPPKRTHSEMYSGGRVWVRDNCWEGWHLVLRQYITHTTHYVFFHY